MGKNTTPNEWFAMAAIGSLGILAAMGYITGKDRAAFNELVRDKNLTDPQEIWNACCDYHKKLRDELAQARTRVEAGEEICRVGIGLSKVRKMMTENNIPAGMNDDLVIKEDMTEDEVTAIYKKIQTFGTPVQVKQAIISYWWSELLKLFVPWGFVLSEEIDVKNFRIIEPEIREAVLRAELARHKSSSESFKRMFLESVDELLELERKHRQSIDNLLKEKDALKDQVIALQSQIKDFESGKINDDIG